MRILAISGSLRRDSYNTQLLRAAGELAADGLDVERYEGLAAIPPYDGDVEALGTPASVVELKRRIAAADVVLIATPEYNSSIPGQLKNALDWVSRPIKESPFRSKPTAVVGASTSAYGGVWAQAELRKVLGMLGARVVEGEVAVPNAADHFDTYGRLVHEETRRQLAQLLDDLVAAAEPVAAAA
jgi:chromate reductase, NAD(P)H dehydrogenase (quinone)